MSYASAYEQLIARNYDASYAVARDPSGDAAFYRQLARETGGPVLELGCGTGRVLLPIANDGVDCLGLDPSAAMLEHLLARAGFTDLTFYGNFDRALWTAGGETIVLARLPTRAS